METIHQTRYQLQPGNKPLALAMGSLTPTMISATGSDPMRTFDALANNMILR